VRNKYPGLCYRCHKWVAKGEGHFERYKGRWRTQHASCCIVYRDLKYQEPTPELIGQTNG